ncbi:MAG: penicillin-binding protein 2, partial [Eggerthellaceae bacterium]|nr:penicillin-binding protein 2 [Eggerthellaceae bacterium]
VSVPDVAPENYKIVRDALKLVAADADRVVDACEDYDLDPTTISSKTGTGEVAGKGDVAWFVCYYPQDKPKYVVATCIEQGGGGAQTAGPVGARVLGAWIKHEKGELDEIGRVAGSNGKSVEVKFGSAARSD